MDAIFQFILTHGKDAYAWLAANYAQLIYALIAIVGGLETITNLLPTKTGAGALSRIGKGLDTLRDKLGLPVNTTGQDPTKK